MARRPVRMQHRTVELRGWGEIAAYLRMSVRTAQRLRERWPDMPVYSLTPPGSASPHWRADVRELARWRDEAAQRVGPPPSMRQKANRGF